MTIPCWNCGIQITKSENWTPENRLWIEDIDNCPKQHDFKKCYREKMDRERVETEYDPEQWRAEQKLRLNPSWAWIPHNDYKGRWGAPEWVIKHYQSLTEFGKCVFPECFCKVIDSWKQ